MGQLIEMPNGEVVEVDDNITPDALKQLEAKYSQTRTSLRKAPLTSEQKEVQSRVAMRNKNRESGVNAYLPGFLKPDNTVTTGVNKGLFANFADEIGAGASAALVGIPKAVMHGDVGEIGREYRVSRDTQREVERQAMERNPGTAVASEIAGAVLNPLGTGERVVAGAGQLLGKLGLERAAAGLGGTAAKMAEARAIPQAIMAGGAQGALNAAGATENLSEVPGAIVNGAGVGALFGGALGGVTHLGAKGVQTVLDALPANASRTAYARIAQLLENGKMTPKQARDEIEMTDIMGGNALVQDLTPGLRAQAAAISRRPGVPASNDLIERGEQRIANRRERFGQTVRDETSLPVGQTDALARMDEIQGGRRAAGQADYAEGGAMDAPLQWSDDMAKFFRENPDADNVVREAYKGAQRRGEDLGKMVMGEDGVIQGVPSMRVFDRMKRAYDDMIGGAMSAGRKSEAGDISASLNRLKGLIGEANPQYKEILATQRDAFQKQTALELGQQVLSRIGKDPRVLHKELMALPEATQKEARIGIIDALINADRKADPVAVFRNISRNDAQKKILEFAFGGRGNLGRFERWVNREIRSTRADVLTAPGRQSETSRIAMAADDEAGGVTGVLSNAMRGYAFGGAVGAMSGVTRTLQNIATGTSKFAQEEIAKILLSKGDDLVKGIDATKAYQKARDTSNRRRARTMGKAGQQLFTDLVGGG